MSPVFNLSLILDIYAMYSKSAAISVQSFIFINLIDLSLGLVYAYQVNLLKTLY